jgi:hypothetical protein
MPMTAPISVVQLQLLQLVIRVATSVGVASAGRPLIVLRGRQTEEQRRSGNTRSATGNFDDGVTPSGHSLHCTL